MQISPSIFKVIFAAILLFASEIVTASTPFPMTPNWFQSLYQNFKENTDEVWRGRIIDVQNPTQLIIENKLSKQKTTVNLLHLSQKDNNDSNDLDYQMRLLRQLLNKEVYVLSNPKDNKVYAKIIDSSGRDMNLNLVQIGGFDINETTLLFKSEKAAYISQKANALQNHRGIWKNF